MVHVGARTHSAGVARVCPGDFSAASSHRTLIVLSPSAVADNLRAHYGPPAATSDAPHAIAWQAAPDRDAAVAWIPPPSALLIPPHPLLVDHLWELAAASLRTAAIAAPPFDSFRACDAFALGWARWAHAAGVDLELYLPDGDPIWSAVPPGPVDVRRGSLLSPPPLPSPTGVWIWAPHARTEWWEWFRSCAAPLIAAASHRSSDVRIVLHGPTPALLSSVLRLSGLGASAKITVVLLWSELLPPAAPPARPSPPPPFVAPSAPHSLRVCAAVDACPLCLWHDGLYAEWGIGPTASLTRVAAFSSTLRRSPSWWQHQPPDLIPLERDSVLDPRDPGPASRLIPLILSAIASSPPPPVARVQAPSRPQAPPGVAMDWVGDGRPCSRTPTILPLPLSARHQAVMTAVGRGLAYGWLEATPAATLFPSMLAFAVEQGDKYRVCVDPAEANSLVLPAPTRYARPGDLLVSPSAACAAKLDVKSAFLSLVILDVDRPFLSIEVGGVHLGMTRLWFGLRNGPRDFQAVMADVTAPCRDAIGHPASVVAYMDDLAVSSTTPAGTAIAVVGILLGMLAGGLLPAVQKCHFAAASTLRFLGTLVDLPSRVLRVAPSAALRALSDVTALLSTTTAGEPLAPAPAELLRSLLGRLAFFSAALPSLSPFCARLRAASSRGTMTGDARAEAQALAHWLPFMHLDSHDRAPTWPVLFIVCDAAKAADATATGGALSILLGGSDASRGVRFAHYDLARHFPPSAIANSYGFELATITLAIERANAASEAFGSVFSLTDAASVAASLAAAPPSVRRAQAGGAPVGAVQRHQVRSAAAAEVMCRLVAALRRPGTRNLRFMATAHHPRTAASAKVADAWSDAGGRVAFLHHSAAATVAALIGPMTLDLAARSEETAMAPAWCVVGSGDDGRFALLRRALDAAAGARHSQWPDLPSATHLHASRSAWLLAWGGAFARWRPWLSDVLPGYSGIFWCADIPTSPTLAQVALVLGPPRWFFTIPLSAGPVVEPDAAGSRPAVAWGCRHLVIAAFASAAAWAAWRSSPAASRCECSQSPARAGWTSPHHPPRTPCHCVALRRADWRDRCLTKDELAVAWMRGGRCRGDGPRAAPQQRAPVFVVTNGQRRPILIPTVIWPDGRIVTLAAFRRRIAGDRGRSIGSSDADDRADAARDIAASDSPGLPDAGFAVPDDEVLSPDRTPPSGPQSGPGPAGHRPPRASPFWKRRQRLLAARSAAAALRAEALSASEDSSDADWSPATSTSSSPSPSPSPSPRAPRRAPPPSPPGPLSAWRARRPQLAPAPLPRVALVAPTSTPDADPPARIPEPPALVPVLLPDSPPPRPWSVSSSATPSPSIPPLRHPTLPPPIPQSARPTAATEARLAVTRSGRCPGDNPIRARPREYGARTPPASRAAVAPARASLFSPATALALALGVAASPFGRRPTATPDSAGSPATPSWALLPPLFPASPLVSRAPAHDHTPVLVPPPATPRAWLPLPCAQCAATVAPDEDARLCDADDCSGWLVCRSCAPPDADPVSLLCPRHQLFPASLPCPSVDVRATLTSSTIGTVGRWLARLVALAVGWPPHALRPWPVSPADPASTATLLDGLVDAGRASLWTEARQEGVRGTLLRMHALLVVLKAPDLPLSYVSRLAEGYVIRRLEAPLPGWRPVLPRTVGAELSAVAAASRSDSLPLPAYCGPAVRALLLHRGGMERPEHTRAYPLTLYPLWRVRDEVPRHLRIAHRALCFQIIMLLRSGMPPRLRRGMMQRCGPGWVLAWRRRTKVRRGDRAANDPVMSPQVSAAAGPVIEWVMAAAGHDHDDLLFPALERRHTDELLRLVYRDIPPDFVLRPHGGRSGGDAILQVLRVPPDIIDTQAWWTRPRRSSGYYGCLCIDVFFAATSMMHLVILEVVAPGMVRFVALADGATIPDWDQMRLAPPSLPPIDSPPTIDSLSDSSDDDARVAVASDADAAAWSARDRRARSRQQQPASGR